MTQDVLAFWSRAATTIKTAAAHTDDDPDSAASRAYYAAFYAVSALFAREGRVFKKHQAIEAAVHRDLVRAGKWPKELGEKFSWLGNLRYSSDYDVIRRATPGEAKKAVSAARAIIPAVRDACPGLDAQAGRAS